MGTFWQDVKTQAVAGGAVVVIAATLGGIGYLIYTVPRQLTLVLEKQEELKVELAANRHHISENARKLSDLDGRLIRLETMMDVKK